MRPACKRLSAIAGLSLTLAACVAAPALAANEIAYGCGHEIDICLLDPANPGAVTNLTDNGTDSYDRTPIWSPDGSKVAFVSDYAKAGHGNWNVFVMNTTATDQAINLATQITDYEPPEKTGIFDLAWSPDGSRIAFTRGNNVGGDQVIVVNADGTSVFPLPIGGPGNNRFPTWSPDSTKIAYATTKGAPEQIYVGSSLGGIGSPLANGVGHEPVWSPDGSKIAFDGYQGGKNFGYVDLHVVNVDGSGTPLIVVPNSYTEWTHSAWSPDGSRIAYRATNNEGKTIYRVVNANGTGDHAITTPGEGNDWHASWSPDGARLVFQHAPYGSPSSPDLYVANADGSGSPQQLTFGGKGEEPAWRVVLSIPQAPPPHPGAKKPKVVWITRRIPWTPGQPLYVASYFCAAPSCSVSTEGKAKGAIAAGLNFRPFAARGSTGGGIERTKGGRKPSWVLVGTGKTKVPGGKTRKLKLSLNKTGVAILKRKGKATFKVTITVKSPGQATVKQAHAIRVYLKQAGKKKKKG
ncbi:MAG TPA: hypothetical protein VG518_03390 [Solirubrobacterales bacterium]|nr:hypothetical protein [Solirubrobacterales bacterium]